MAFNPFVRIFENSVTEVFLTVPRRVEKNRYWFSSAFPSTLIIASMLSEESIPSKLMTGIPFAVRPYSGIS